MLCLVRAIDVLQSIPRDSNDKDGAAMLDELTIEADEKYFVIVLQHGGNDVICERSIKRSNGKVNNLKLIPSRDRNCWDNNLCKSSNGLALLRAKIEKLQNPHKLSYLALVTNRRDQHQIRECSMEGLNIKSPTLCCLVHKRAICFCVYK